jgi:hypothetical protein
MPVPVPTPTPTPITVPCSGIECDKGGGRFTGGHTYLWDPWFLGWGLLLTIVLWRSRAQRAGARIRPGG